MDYKPLVEKYTYRVEWSEEDNTHIARCLEFPSLIAQGDTVAIALKEIEIVVEETLKWMEEESEKIPEPFGLKRYKGNLTLRIPPEVHRSVVIKSAE